jgi:hypothetical protein
MGLSRKNIFIALLFWGFSASHATATESKRWSPEELLRRVQVLERDTVSTADPAQARALESRMKELSTDAARRLAQETGIRLSSKPALPGVRGQEINRWIGALQARPQEQRCDLVRLAYALAISRVSLLKSKTGQTVDRALNELRLFWPLNADAPYAPRNCMSPQVPGRSIVSDAQSRLKSVERGAKDTRS